MFDTVYLTRLRVLSRLATISIPAHSPRSGRLLDELPGSARLLLLSYRLVGISTALLLTSSACLVSYVLPESAQTCRQSRPDRDGGGHVSERFRVGSRRQVAFPQRSMACHPQEELGTYESPGGCFFRGDGAYGEGT